ncbi:MAG TPA: LuxR C-terminal-related transcriptional regulator [Methylophilus sp.]|nr:LuxR C-terminal-related transcriptional regulator [Methylophilus sp.]HQQ33350.1 LuxR C-terminal-related transcriptional regulator [Methylophilus sp.]
MKKLKEKSGINPALISSSTDEKPKGTVMSDKNISNQNWEKIFSVIQKSFSIHKHVDFFNWLQESVRNVLPHDILVAAWGDFSTGELNFDVSSNIEDIRTQKLMDAPGVFAYLMTNLHQRWLDNGERWYRINFFDASGINAQSPTAFTHKLIGMNSLLVYGVRDTRGKNDCIYVFFDRAREFQVQHSVLGLLMPHVDAALRRVEYMEAPVPEEDIVDSLNLGGLSERELEILHWVKSGKTNLEIGMILTISPNTVKNHLKRIFQKLDVTCRAQAVAKYTPQSLPS